MSGAIALLGVDFADLEVEAAAALVAARSDGADFAYVVTPNANHLLAGGTRRAPGWMQRAGLEWLHRLTGDPRRLARRYLVGRYLVDSPPVFALLLKAARKTRS